MANYWIIDTEGNPLLREVAVVDPEGRLVYEAHVGKSRHHKTLHSIIQELTIFAGIWIFHYAEHDRAVLQNSYTHVGIRWPNPDILCTWEMAKQLLPDLPSYSLEYLCKYLNLKVQNQRFNPRLAHVARYDALFTYQLYSRLALMDHPNPFSSNRVDNPFQHHVDFADIYDQEFSILGSLLRDIHAEPNHQSRGAVVVGNPGSGKTHLMMRLAQTYLNTHRLLFISQPNHLESLFHHTYCRVLESLAEKIPDTPFTQLEYLLANTFVGILKKSTLSEKGQKILQDLEHNRLGLYKAVGKEGTQKNLAAWDYIEKQTLTWWAQEYSSAGFGLSILQGITRFCRYRDVQKRETVRRWLSAQVLSEEEAAVVGVTNWKDEISREEFALEALKVLGRLSVLDEPLIIVFDQLEGLWLRHNSSLLMGFGHVVKELITHVPNSLVILNLFPERWQEFQQIFDGSVVERITHEISLRHPSKDQLWDILRLRTQHIGLNLEDIFTNTELSDILTQSSIRSVLKRASQYFEYKTKKLPLPPSEEPLSIPSSHWEDRLEKLEQAVSEIQHLLKSSSLIDKSPPTDFSAEDIFIEALSSEPDLDPMTLEKSEQIPLETFLDHEEDPEMNEIKLYLQEQQKKLEAAYGKPTIVNDSDDLGKLTVIVEAFQLIYSLELDVVHLAQRTIPEHLVIRTADKNYVIAFLHVSANMFTSRIKNFNELVITSPEIQFFLLRDQREPTIKSKVGSEEIKKLENVKNGCFITMDRRNRIQFELIYSLIVDIQNRDLEVNFKKALQILTTECSDYWLIELLSGS